ncbi:MAG: hypothetical protein ACOC80_13560 [Petrotogales bacterium]
MAKKQNKKDVVKIGKEVFKKEAFIIEDEHPALGRILIVDGKKYRVMDYAGLGGHRSGTFIRPLTEEDEQRIKEYEESLDEISELLVNKVDVKRIIKENIRSSPITEIKTGLYILKSEDDDSIETEENHKSGCYQLDLHKGKQTFSFITGRDVTDFNRIAQENDVTEINPDER